MSERQKTEAAARGWNRLKMDEEFDAAAPHGYSRSGAVFAYDDYRTVSRSLGKGGIVLEAWVDPSRIVVADAGTYTRAMMDREMTKDMVESYWGKAIPINEYAQLREKHEKFDHAEVVVPGPIDQKFIRIVSVENVT